MKKITLLMMWLMMLPALSQAAGTLEPDSIKAQADKAFAEERYEEAAKLYQHIADSVASVSVYYNLGCTYYRMDDMAHSVLWLERAHKLDPADEDIEANLMLAREKTIDRITAKHDFVLLDITRRLADTLNSGQWAWTCLGLFVLAMMAMALFVLSDRVAVRKASFLGSIVLLLLCAAGNGCAAFQKHEASQHNAGVIMTSVVTVKSTPSDSGNDLFLLHEGTRVEIRDGSLKDWAEIEIADGKVGWVQKKHFVII